MRTDSLIGAQVANYRIEELIGEGGMSQVYRAEHVVLEKKVALKLLAAALREDKAFRERFLRESRLAASLDHPNIIEIYDAGEAGDLLFIAMRYIAGSDLRRVIHEGGPLPPARALSILGQAARGLDAAHERGLVHRDVKPANILIDGNDHVYLSDFGVAKFTADGRGLTRTGFFVGTLDYAAPEQIRGEPLDARADVYALGCLLYQTLSGELPFARDSDVQVMYAHLEQPAPRLSSAAGLPARLDDVVARAMAKDRADRYGTCEEVVDAAHAALSEATTLGGVAAQADAGPRAAAPPDPERPPTRATVIDRPEGAPALDSRPERPAPARRPRRALIAGGLAAAVVVVAAVAGLLLLSGGGANALGTVKGTVLDARTGKPVAAARVATEGQKPRPVTAAGRFTVHGTDEGAPLRVEACGYATTSVPAHATVRVELQPTPVPGRATSDLTGAGVPALVAGKARAGRDGRFALPGRCAGQIVVLSAPGYRTLRARIPAAGTFLVSLPATSASDGFSNASRSLFGTSRSATSEKYPGGGAYHMQVRRKASLAIQVVKPEVPLRDAVVAVDAKKVAGASDAGYGLVCRWTGPDAFYLVELSSDGYFRLQKKTAGKFVSLQNWKPSDAIRRGGAENRVSASCTGRRPVTVVLSVNGTRLGQATDAAGLPPGRVGLAASTYSRAGTHVQFDNFALQRR